MALPVIQGRAAEAAIDGLAQDHPHIAHQIRVLGAAFLRSALGLRDGRKGASGTYDLSFVNENGAFADLTAQPRKHNRATDGQLQVQLRHQGQHALQAFTLKTRSSEVERGWHATQLAADDDVAPLLEDLGRARIG